MTPKSQSPRIKSWDWTYDKWIPAKHCPYDNCPWAQYGVCLQPTCMEPGHIVGTTKMIVREGDADDKASARAVSSTRGRD